MKQEIKDRWIQKLESGDYVQTTGELQNEEGFCCLGVLCEVAVEDGIITRNPDGDGYLTKYNAYTGTQAETFLVETSVLPREVVEWADLEDNNPTVPYLDEDADEDCPCGGTHEIDPTIESDLAELNDSYKLTFSEIAEKIKDNL